MALVHLSYKSLALGRNVPLTAILPTDYIDYESGRNRSMEPPYKTLYLLHGLNGDCSEWITHTDIKRLSERNNIAVIMPSGDNSFYINLGKLHSYSEFIGEELVDMTRKMFNLSRKREDTFIGGASMGGFGALYNGFKYDGRFSKIIALSPAFVPEEDIISGDNLLIKHYKSYLENVFGSMDSIHASELNPDVFSSNLIDEDNLKQDLYLACAEDDYLTDGSRSFKDMVENNERINLNYFEGDGGHGWDYWNSHMENVMEWLNSDKK